MRAYREKHSERLKAQRIRWWAELRREVLLHYSDNDIKCACCGEDEYKFMALDHVDGGGTQHRLELGSKNVFSSLRKLGFPPGYQVLCHNCNMAKGFYGICPHKEKLVVGEINGEVSSNQEPETLTTESSKQDS